MLTDMTLTSVNLIVGQTPTIYNLIIINVTYIWMFRNYLFSFGQNFAKRSRNMERHRERNIAEPKFELKSFHPRSCIFYGRGRI